MTSNPACSFSLKLSNSQSWNISSEESTREWTERFASILNLSRASSKEESFTMQFGRSSTGELKDGREIYIEVPANLSPKANIFSMWKSILPIYKQALTTGGIPIHAAFVEREGKGFLLAAPGGTGKTTCCQRLPAGWSVLCDDETLLLLSDDGNSYNGHAFPTWSNFYLDRPPWNWNVERSCSVNAIFFLQQAKIDSIEPLGQGKSSALIYQASAQIYRRIWNELDVTKQEELKQRLFALSGNIALQIPAFMLNVSLEGKFWELIDDELSFHDAAKQC